MIDLHSHVLPGVDDGPAQVEDSVELLRAAAAQGTTVLAATPHLRSDYPQVSPRDFAAACAALNERVSRDCDIRVVPGAELDVVWALNASDEELKLASFGQRGTDLLLETPYGHVPDTFEDSLFQISVRGYRLLLAHPERSADFQRNPERLRQLVRSGVLIQVTLPSVLNKRRGSNSRKLAHSLIRDGLAHNLASDSHSAGPWRAPELQAGVDALADVAPAHAEWMVTDAPAAILEGASLPHPPRESVRPKRRLRFPGLRG